VILHVDMDAFYASIEQREHPELVGRAVIVGGAPQGRGVVAAASYEARAFGVRSAMPAATARRLCPQAVFVRPRIDLYAKISEQMRAVLLRYTPLVETIALDEAFLDVSASTRLLGPPEQIAARIKGDIRAELALNLSVGVAPNKFLAKLASARDKPDGLVVVRAGEEQAFLDPLPVARLWGVGRVAQVQLEALGVHTIGDLRREAAERLRARLGRTGEHLWRLAHGLDERPVVPEREARSLSHETTFEVDVDSVEVLRAWMLELTGQVARRLRRSQLRARTVRVKVRFSDFTTRTRAHTLPAPTSLTRELWRAARSLLEGALGSRVQPVRLVGMGVSGIEAAGAAQGDLFGEPARRREGDIDALLDRAAERFGPGALRRGAGPR